MRDASCKVLITADGVWRGSKIIPLKEIADQARINIVSNFRFRYHHQGVYYSIGNSNLR